MNPCADPNSNIHIVYADKNGDDPFEIYYLCKGSSDNNFGNYPGTLVSSDSDSSNYHSEFPSCAYSEYNDTAYVHVVWSTEPEKYIHYRRLNLNTDVWTPIDSISPSGDYGTRPSITVDSFNDVHVVWENDVDEDNYNTRYMKYTASTGQWSDASTLIAPESVDDYGLPVLVADVYDDLHLLMTGHKSIPTAEDVFHTWYDAPPHIEDLEFLANESDEDSVVISWTGWDEPDLDTYRIYRKYLGQSWALIDSTTDTRYSDTESSFSPGGFSEIDYYVVAVDDASQTTYSDTIAVAGTEQNKLNLGGYAIARFELRGNYPNPFNAQTTIEYNIPFETDVKIEIFDILGRKIETLVSDRRPTGLNQVVWNADNIASGMYFYRLQAENYTATRRMSIIK